MARICWVPNACFIVLYNSAMMGTVGFEQPRLTSVHPIPGKVRRGHDGGSRRVFRQFSWLEVDSVKAALSRPAHQRVTQAVSRLSLTTH